MTNIDKAKEILRQTDEGYNIAPHELKLVDRALQGYVHDDSQEQLDYLYTTVMDGSYQYPWHMGVEHMTLAHSGDIRFKGQPVDHFNPLTAYSLAAKSDLEKLQQYCLFLESKGEKIELFPWAACAWSYHGTYAEDFAQEKKAELDGLLNEGQAILFSHIRVKNDAVFENFLIPGHPDQDGVRSSIGYRDLQETKWIDDACPIQMATYVYGDGRWVHATPEQLSAIDLVFDYLKEKELAVLVSEDRYEAAPEEDDEMEP